MLGVPPGRRLSTSFVRHEGGGEPYQEFAVTGIVQQDVAFHRSILVGSGQQDLITIWRTLVARIRNHFHRAVESYAGKLLKTHLQHRELLDTFRSGDRDVARKALAAHIW